MILRESVTSSQIAKIGYNPASCTLEVQFHPSKSTGVASVWRYYAVPRERFEQLKNAPSIGADFAQIKRTYRAALYATIDAAGVEHRQEIPA